MRQHVNEPPFDWAFLDASESNTGTGSTDHFSSTGEEIAEARGDTTVMLEKIDEARGEGDGTTVVHEAAIQGDGAESPPPRQETALVEGEEERREEITAADGRVPESRALILTVALNGGDVRRKGRSDDGAGGAMQVIRELEDNGAGVQEGSGVRRSGSEGEAGAEGAAGVAAGEETDVSSPLRPHCQAFSPNRCSISHPPRTTLTILNARMHIRPLLFVCILLYCCLTILPFKLPSHPFPNARLFR